MFTIQFTAAFCFVSDDDVRWPCYSSSAGVTFGSESDSPQVKMLQNYSRNNILHHPWCWGHSQGDLKGNVCEHRPHKPITDSSIHTLGRLKKLIKDTTTVFLLWNSEKQVCWCFSILSFFTLSGRKTWDRLCAAIPRKKEENRLRVQRLRLLSRLA